MARKALLIACFAVLLVSETVYFARQCAGGLLRLRGERALFRNDHEASWRHYRAALSWGGDQERLETDVVELLLFGLDQLEAGLKIEPALPPEESVRLARRLNARRILEVPYSAYQWSIASDLLFHAARRRRLETPIDLTTLSEDPLENLLPEDRLGIAALQTAARLEPSNYLYLDLLVEMFLEMGSPGEAARYCRLAVAAYPALTAHPYIFRRDLSPEILEAAVEGFEDARAGESMIRKSAIECDAGRLLAWHGQRQRALAFLRRAIALAPDLYDARYELGILAFEMRRYPEALEHLREASKALPESSSPHLHMGLSHLEMGDLGAAIEEFRIGKAKDPRDLRFFHLLGEVLERTGQAKEAERQFLAAANLNPGEAGAWSSLLAFYVRHRDFRGAADVCSRLAALRPGDGTYREGCASLGQEFR